MRVLITNNVLARRGGIETFGRQLARGLEARGHSVVAYSSDPRQGERLLETDVMPVVTDLERLPFRPDVIHGQHHLDTMTALNALPGVPAIYQSHGAVWRTWCPKHPRIYRYVTVSSTLRERVIAESCLDPERVEVLLNGVDLKRFAWVRRPSATPLRALLFNSRHEEGSATVAAIREAAARTGLELDLMGFHFATSTDEPEKLLPAYDIVFASGLSAIEALASGCAVVVLGRSSCGDMVLEENFDRFRRTNFSIATNSPPPSVAHIEAQIRRYSAPDCERVTARIRREADFELSIDRLLIAYEAAIGENASRPSDLNAELLANFHYLRAIVPLIKATDDYLGRRWSSASQSTSVEHLNARLVRVETHLKALKRD